MDIVYVGKHDYVSEKIRIEESYLKSTNFQSNDIMFIDLESLFKELISLTNSMSISKNTIEILLKKRSELKALFENYRSKIYIITPVMGDSFNLTHRYDSYPSGEKKLYVNDILTLVLPFPIRLEYINGSSLGTFLNEKYQQSIDLFLMPKYSLNDTDNWIPLCNLKGSSDVISAYMKANKNIIFLPRIKDLNKFINELVTIEFEENNYEMPEWVKNIELFNSLELKDEISDLTIQQSEIAKKIEIENLKLQNIYKYKKVLYTSGKALEKIVKIILIEIFDVKTEHKDIKQEDYLFDIDNKRFVVEIKGENQTFQRNYIRQLNDFISEVALRERIPDNEIDNKYRGLIIFNPFYMIPVEERLKQIFCEPELIKKLEREDFFAIDTISLLSIYCDYKNKSKSIDEIKEIFLNRHYCEKYINWK